jgi:phosphotransferase system enzyme I (PtsI)
MSLKNISAAKNCTGRNKEAEQLELKGIGISEGIAIGHVHKLEALQTDLEEAFIGRAQVSEEQTRLEAALSNTRAYLTAVISRLPPEDERAQIMMAQYDIANDRQLKKRALAAIETELVTAEKAVYDVMENFAHSMESLSDAYYQERAADIRDVRVHILRLLLGRPPGDDILTESVLTAEELTPSVLSSADHSKLLGLISGQGGKTSHIAIIARGMGIPAAAGIGEQTGCIRHGDLVILDGTSGKIFVNPDAETIAVWTKKQREQRATAERLRQYIAKPAVTRDGRHRVLACANLAFPEECAAAKANGADGVGLFRSEFLYMSAPDWPDEETQFRQYRRVAEAMAPNHVIVRTLDIGGDKGLDYWDAPREENPFLGFRAIRLCLARPDIFRTQLRALLRASAFGSLGVMFPMICCVEEVRAAKTALEAAKAELRREGLPFDEDIEVGIMVEIPAAAVMADLLIQEVDFFSIGSNDLIQYTVAADRTNGAVSRLYDCFSPAVLRLIKHTIDAAHRHGKWVGMCGEMAGMPAAAPLLAGLGLDEFSMSPASLLSFKEALAGVTYGEARELAARAMNCITSGEVKKLLKVD